MSALPPETLQLATLPVNEENVKSLARFSVASKSFFAASRDPLLWKPFYIERYKHVDTASETNRRRRLGDNWSSLYYERRQLDQHTLRGISRIAQECNHKAQLPIARTIVEHGMDVYDALSEDVGVRSTGIIEARSDRLSRNPDHKDHTRKAWVYRMIHIITARDALKRPGWDRLKKYLSGQEVSLPSYEEAFACPSSFHGIFADDVRIINPVTFPTF